MYDVCIYDPARPITGYTCRPKCRVRGYIGPGGTKTANGRVVVRRVDPCPTVLNSPSSISLIQSLTQSSSTQSQIPPQSPTIPTKYARSRQQHRRPQQQHRAVRSSRALCLRLGSQRLYPRRRRKKATGALVVSYEIASRPLLAEDLHAVAASAAQIIARCGEFVATWGPIDAPDLAIDA